MGELSLSLPVVGEKDTTAEPKVTTALSEIQTQFNGKIAAVNLEAKAVGDAAIASNRALVTTNNHYVAKSFTKVEAEAEIEPSATRLAIVSLLFATKETTSTIIVGGVTIYSATWSPVTFLVPPTQKWKAFVAVEAATLLL